LGTIDALPVFAWYLGYERRWNSDLRSTFTYKGASSQFQLGSNFRF
jgi:hypothetical protein